jgi:hypothetical protein
MEKAVFHARLEIAKALGNTDKLQELMAEAESWVGGG